MSQAIAAEYQKLNEQKTTERQIEFSNFNTFASDFTCTHY